MNVALRLLMRKPSTSNPLTGVFRTLVGSADTGTTKTTVPFAIGTAAANREVIVTVINVGAAAVSSITVGGVSMSLVVSQSANTSIYRAVVPTGTTASISCVQTAAVGILFHVWTIHGGIANVNTNKGSTFSTSISRSVTAYANGFVCASVYGSSGMATGLSWSGVTLDSTFSPTSAASAAASAGSLAVAVSGSGTLTRELVVAAFGG